MRSALLLFLRANRRHLAELLVASVLINLMMLALPLFSMLVYDKAVGNQVHDTLWALAIGMGLLLVLEVLMRGARMMLIEHAGARWDAFLDQRLIRGLLLAPATRPVAAGEVVARVREVAATRDALSAQCLLGLADVPFVVLFAVVMAWVAGPLVLIPLVLGGLLVGLSWGLQRMADGRQREANRAMRSKIAGLVDVLAARDSLGGSRRQATVEARYRSLALGGARAAARARWWQQWQGQITPFITGLGTLAVMVAGVFRIESQLLSTGGLISANMLGSRLLYALCTMAPLASRWREFFHALQGLSQSVGLEAAADDAVNRSPAALATEGIRLDAVAVGFPGQTQPALAGLDLHLKTGELVAVVGNSGSGKSTLLRLLAGQLAHQGGRLAVGAECIDGDDARRWLQMQSHLKAQDPGYLGGSLREIVSDGEPDLSDDTLVAALRHAGLGAALDRGELGLNSVVGTQGAGLSGGQRQGVALAAAFCSTRPILLLDEPTLGLDRPAQERVLEQLPRLREGRCVLVATHAAELIQRADRVIVIDRGRIVADGHPDRLMSAAAHAPRRRTAASAAPEEKAESA